MQRSGAIGATLARPRMERGTTPQLEAKLAQPDAVVEETHLTQRAVPTAPTLAARSSDAC
jgi:hypothetical protein